MHMCMQVVFIMYMWAYVGYVQVYAGVYGVQQHQHLWSWSYRWLNHQIWVLGTKLMSSLWNILLTTKSFLQTSLTPYFPFFLFPPSLSSSLPPSLSLPAFDSHCVDQASLVLYMYSRPVNSWSFCFSGECCHHRHIHHFSKISNF